jgi:hypothetical protein
MNRRLIDTLTRLATTIPDPHITLNVCTKSWNVRSESDLLKHESNRPIDPVDLVGSIEMAVAVLTCLLPTELSE